MSNRLIPTEYAKKLAGNKSPFTGLSVRAYNCLTGFGFHNRAEVLEAVCKDVLVPWNKRCRNYGCKTHIEVLRWLRVYVQWCKSHNLIPKRYRSSFPFPPTLTDKPLPSDNDREVVGHPSGLSGEHDVVLDAIQEDCLHQ